MTAPDCPFPSTCPVPDPTGVDLRRLRLAHLEAGRVLSRVHPGRYPAVTLNGTGRSDSRFASLGGRAHAYAGDSRTVALLETCFHNVHQAAPRVIYAAPELAGWSLTQVTVHTRVPLVDLRDPQLARLGLDRGQLVATSPSHYPCTRQWGVRLLGRRIGGVAPAGLLWHSRVAELTRADSVLFDDLLDASTAEVCAVYDVVPWVRSAGGFASLVDGQGRLLVDHIAEQLDAEIT